MRTYVAIIFVLALVLFASYFAYAASESCSSYQCGEGYVCNSYCTDSEETPQCSYDLCACTARIPSGPLPMPGQGVSLSCTGADIPETTTAYDACGSVTDYGATKCFSKQGSHIEPITTDAYECVGGTISFKY